MKKILVLVFALLLALSAFCGCTRKPAPSNEDDIGNGKGDGSTVNQPITYQTYGSYWMPQHNYKTMPVAAFNACPPQLATFTHNYLTSESTFAAYKEAGVNTIMGLKENAGSDEVLQALDWCDEYGLAYLLPLPGAESLANTSIVKGTLARAKYHSAFAGIMHSDEPGRVLFESIANSAELLKEIMPEESDGLLFHVNLFPNYANQMQLYHRSYTSSSTLPEGGYSYAQYVSDFMEICKPRVLSYDYYPCVGHEHTLTKLYFENMSVIREAALKANVPFWVYVQTCSFNPANRIPDQADLLWQVNTALAYGAKGIQYFTGVLPENSHESFTGAMFDRDGNRTDVYEYVKRAGAQIGAIDEVLMCSKSKGVILTGVSPWGQDSYIPEKDLITSYGCVGSIAAEHVITGCFDYNGKPAYYVVNNSVLDSDAVTVTFTSSQKGYIVKGAAKEAFNGSNVTFNLDAGDGALIVIE